MSWIHVRAAARRSLSKTLGLGLGDFHPETIEIATFPKHLNDLNSLHLRCGYCVPPMVSDPGQGH
jgi:hypothetical protein